MRRSSSTSSTLNGLFTDAYAKCVSERPSSDFSKSNYNYWNTGYTGVVHPLTFADLQKAVMKLKENEMPTHETEGPCQESTPLQRELDNRKYAVRSLRTDLKRKQEELRIQLALLKAIKKLAKGGK